MFKHKSKELPYSFLPLNCYKNPEDIQKATHSLTVMYLSFFRY